ncbi:MAG: thioesterase family protein [Paracoccaceae bacterium]
MTTELNDISSYTMFEPVTLRYSDQDGMGHVNNVAYAALFEAGRLGLLTALLEGAGDQRFNFVLANLNIDYRQEMHFPGTVQVGGKLLRFGEKSITTGFGAFLNGVCHATATCVNVFFDPVTRRSRPFPDNIRAAFTADFTAGAAR